MVEPEVEARRLADYAPPSASPVWTSPVWMTWTGRWPDARHTRDTTAEIAYLTRALKAPTLRDAVDRLAERARVENWTHQEFLAACPPLIAV